MAVVKTVIFCLALLVAIFGAALFYYKTDKLARDSDGYHIGFARTYAPGLVVINTNHPDCPAAVADKYRKIQKNIVPFFLGVLAVFFLTK